MNKAIRRVLVTGGAGFIGSHTVDLLLREGKDVVVLDNLFSGKLTNLDLNHPNLEFIEGDILDYFLLQELVVNCDAVLHLAAISSVPLSIENPIYAFQVNTQGFLHVLEAIFKANRPIRLVYASSAAVYGESKEVPCKDNIPLTAKPLSPYALQKMNSEQYADLYQRLHHIPSLALRYFNVYGLRQDPASPYSGVISRFMNAYQQDMPVTIYGDGTQSRDYIHVSDVARANLLALESDTRGALNIATGVPTTLLQLIEMMGNIGQKEVKTQFETARSGDIMASYAETADAKEALHFEFAVSLKKGLQDLLRPQS